MRPFRANVGLPDLIRLSTCFVGSAIASPMPGLTGGSFTLTIGAQAAISLALGPLAVARDPLVQPANTNPRPSVARTAPALVMRENFRPTPVIPTCRSVPPPRPTAAVCISAETSGAKHLEASLKTFDLDVVAGPGSPRCAVQFQINNPIRPVPSQHQPVAVLAVPQRL